MIGQKVIKSILEATPLDQYIAELNYNDELSRKPDKIREDWYWISSEKNVYRIRFGDITIHNVVWRVVLTWFSGRAYARIKLEYDMGRKNADIKIVTNTITKEY